MLNRQHRHHETPGSSVTALSGSRSVRLRRGNTSGFDPMCDILLLQRFQAFVLFSNSGRCCWLKCWLTRCVFGNGQSSDSAGDERILPAGPTGFFCSDAADVGVVYIDLGQNETWSTRSVCRSLLCRRVVPAGISLKFGLNHLLFYSFASTKLWVSSCDLQRIIIQRCSTEHFSTFSSLFWRHGSRFYCFV